MTTPPEISVVQTLIWEKVLFQRQISEQLPSTYLFQSPLQGRAGYPRAAILRSHSCPSQKVVFKPSNKRRGKGHNLPLPSRSERSRATGKDIKLESPSKDSSGGRSGESSRSRVRRAYKKKCAKPIGYRRNQNRSEHAKLAGT